MNNTRYVGSLGVTLLASALLLASLKLPLWQMRLEAPQYREQEALRIAVHPDSLRGDLKEFSVLNQYIGVYTSQYGVFLAGTLLAIIPPAILFLTLQREFISGLTTGAVKQ